MLPVHKLHALTLFWKQLLTRDKLGLIEKDSLEDELMIALPWATTYIVSQLSEEDRLEYFRLTGNLE